MIAECAYSLGFRWNHTDSIPQGLYQLTNQKIIKGSFILFCPDNREAFQSAIKRQYLNAGFCAIGSEPLMKQVLATKGDVVSSNEKGVFVNGVALPFSAPKEKDGLNQVMSKWQVKNYKLQSHEFLTMTNQDEWSYDSRYYGLIYLSQIKGMVTPIWVSNKQEKRHA